MPPDLFLQGKKTRTTAYIAAGSFIPEAAAVIFLKIRLMPFPGLTNLNAKIKITWLWV